LDIGDYNGNPSVYTGTDGFSRDPELTDGVITISGGVSYYDLTVNIVGSGTVTLDPPGGTYAEDTSVELTANPASGWKFTGWSGDLTGSDNPETILMDSDKEVTATFAVAVPDIDGSGTLDWVDVQPSSTVTGEITVENVGETGSKLNWEVSEWPEWGTWTFTPSSGTGLTPAASPKTISVSVVAPEDKNTEFSGTVKIVNSDDSSDYFEVSVSLVTPRARMSFDSLLQQFIQLLCERFPLFEQLFG
jgi:uncharacterized repeat protein (TIGR02543 family)